MSARNVGGKLIRHSLCVLLALSSWAPIVESFVVLSSHSCAKLREVFTRREGCGVSALNGRSQFSSVFSRIRMDVSVTLPTPLGIVFEEVEPGQNKGVVVASFLPGGNAESDGRILVGDKLLATSAVILDNSRKPLIGLGGAIQNTNWKREMIPTGNLDFETIMNAIRSNSGRYGYRDVRLTFRRTDRSIPRSTETLVRSRQEKAAQAAGNVDVPMQPSKDAWED